MGYDLVCKATLGKQAGEGKAMLETDFIQFRSHELNFKVLLSDLTEVKIVDELLELRFAGQLARLELGQKVAEKWRGKILNPPSRLDKLGIKAGTKVLLKGAFDAEFKREVANRISPAAEDSDLIFVSANTLAELEAAAPLAKRMRPDAGLWIVYPRGRVELREADVISAGRSAGLKDVKVVRFSESHTALKFVIPLVARPRRESA